MIGYTVTYTANDGPDRSKIFIDTANTEVLYEAVRTAKISTFGQSTLVDFEFADHHRLNIVLRDNSNIRLQNFTRQLV